MPVYLGVDYGTKRIGLAWADELGISLPLESIPGVELEGCWEEFARVVREREVTEIVVTSVAAAESLSVKSKGRKGRKPADGRIDATAASLILRDFLEGKGA